MNLNLVQSKLGLMKPVHSEPVHSNNIAENTKNKQWLVQSELVHSHNIAEKT